MKHLFTFLLLLSFSGILKSQTVFDSFDTPIESNYTVNNGGLSDSSRFSYYLEKEIVSEGEGALGLKYTVESIAEWGGGCQLRLVHPDASGVWDLSDYESLSFDFYNKVPSSESGRALVQVLLFEASDVDDIANAGMRKLEWWYSFHRVLDRGEGWQTIELPLKDVGDIADDGQGGTGFWLTGNDGAMGNSKLDLNKIRSIVIGLRINGPLDHKMIKGEFILDNFRLMGKKT